MLSIGASGLNTLIPVEELLDALKELQRAEIEAEQMEDESVNRHEAGRLGEYQVCVRCSFPSGCTIHPAPAPAPPGVCEALSLTTSPPPPRLMQSSSSSCAETGLLSVPLLQRWEGAV